MNLPTRLLAVLVPLALLLPVATPGGLALGDVPGDEAAPDPGIVVWGERDALTARDLHSVHFHNTTLGWVGADHGAIYRTVDGGVTWEVQHTGLPDAITRMAWVDATHGWASTVDRGLARTLDGGETWQVLRAGGWIGAFENLMFLDAETGYAVGENAIFQGYLEVTHDGGETWEWMSLRFTDTESKFVGLHFSEDGSRGIVTTWLYPRTAGVSVSEDGGETWTFVEVDPASPTFKDLAMATEDVGVVVGYGGAVHRTTDGGYHWSRVRVPTASTLLDVDFVDSERGWAVGEGGTVLHTRDGGLTWSLELSGTREALQAAAFEPGGEGWAVSTDGTVRHRSASASAEDRVREVAPLPSTDTTPHLPIVITGDAGFEKSTSGVTGGSGTADDPYVIEGWEIVPSLGDGMTLVGTNAHVVIRNNHIHDAALDHSGIRLVDARNVVVESNRVERVANGVVATGGGDLELRGNVISHAASMAVDVARAERVAVDANLLQASGSDGIRLSAVDHAAVTGNDMVFNRLAGIRLTLERGVGTTGAVVMGNAFQDNGYGVHATGADRLRVEGNLIALSTRAGVQVALGEEARVAGNVFRANNGADVLVGERSLRTVVEGNDLQPVDFGIRLRGDEDTILRANRVASNLLEAQGIRADGSVRTRIVDNVVEGVYHGIRLASETREAEVRGNLLQSRIHGVWIQDGASDNVVAENQMISQPWLRGRSMHDGVVILQGSPRNTVQGNLVEGVDVGISVAGASEDVVVERNHVRDVRFNGIDVAFYSHRAIVRQNLVENVGGAAISVLHRSDEALVEDNVIRNVTGRALGSGSSSWGVFRNNTVTNASIGYESMIVCPFQEGECDSEGNLVEHNTYSVIRDMGVLVRNRTAAAQTIGLHIEDNTFAGEGGTAWDVRDAPNTTLTGNNLDGFAIGLVAARSGPVEAPHNWWGATDGPSGEGPGSGAALLSDTESDIRFDPWLTARSPTAGA